jgi:hypothetical protein
LLDLIKVIQRDIDQPAVRANKACQVLFQYSTLISNSFPEGFGRKRNRIKHKRMGDDIFRGDNRGDRLCSYNESKRAKGRSVISRSSVTVEANSTVAVGVR